MLDPHHQGDAMSQPKNEPGADSRQQQQRQDQQAQIDAEQHKAEQREVEGHHHNDGIKDHQGADKGPRGQ
jgi:hypothetical protein